MKIVYSWLKEYVGDVLPDAKSVDELLTFHSFEMEGIEEVAGETVLDADVLPNRSSDALCHRGIAREVATLLDTPLVYDPLAQPIEMAAGSKVTITIEDPTLCNRFTAAVIEGVAVKETPAWLKQRLEALGQRSINNVVDATNYVMFALGQPTHVFDFDKLTKDDEGRVNITIRNGREGETLELLGGEVIESNQDTLHLVDGNSDTLLDLAGIKGGTVAEFTKDSVNLVITSGTFNYQSVRKTAQRTKVFTEASQRFQNEPSPELAGYGLEAVAKIILDMAGGTLDGMVESYPVSKKNTTVTVTTAKTNALLGLALNTREIANIIKRIGATVEIKGESIMAIAPWERTDLNIEEDYIEEVARIYGLDKVTAITPSLAPAKKINKRQFYSDQIRQVLIDIGYSEIITSSFQKKGEIQLENALASDKSYVRPSLQKNIEAALDKNFVHVDLLGLQNIRVFEIGTVFSHDGATVTEHLSLALGARTKGNGYSAKDDALVNDGLRAVEQSLALNIDWEFDKGVAETNLTKILETLDEPDKYVSYQKSIDATYKTPSSYPAVARDIALWVEESEDASVVETALTRSAGDLLVRIDLFDTFTKDGKTSYAFRLVFQSHDKTLTDDEVNDVMETLYRVAESHSWQVR